MAYTFLGGVGNTRSRPRRVFVALVAICLFFGSLVLYPPLTKLVQLPLLVSLVAIIFLTLASVIQRRFHVPRSTLYQICAIFGLVYGVWLIIAVVNGNNLTYVYVDSQGFLVYLAGPVVFVFCWQYGLFASLHGLVLFLTTFVAALCGLISVSYYLIVGGPDSLTLSQINSAFRVLGINIFIDHNYGLLGFYTFLGQFFLLAIALAAYDWVNTRRRRNLVIIGVQVVGIITDGHRALVISCMLLFVLLFWIYRKRLAPKVKRRILGVTTLVILVTLVFFADWIGQRFNFGTSDISSNARYAQVPALMEKILESPVMGSGFGSYANVIRSHERPYYYEVDFLATIMKLGILGSLLYFGTYLYVLALGVRRQGEFGKIIAATGIAFFLYMGTNGGTAMSTDSSILHLILFLFIFSPPDLWIPSSTESIEFRRT